MNPDTSKPDSGTPIPPVSVFAGPIAELVGHRLLSPPTRPGLLASLARFEVLRVLGRGGMGIVVLARDADTGKEVAIKLIRPELVSEQRVLHRFVKEAGHLKKLEHPNIVPVLEVSDRAEGPYFVMPYFSRGSLSQRIRPGQPLETEIVLDLALDVASGLSFAHRKGIIHRDLKPANILIDESGRARLADFGLARTMFNDSIIEVGSDQFEGTAAYTSPGVAAGNAEDTRCDMYSFGALLYEMLTGEPPYAGRNSKEIRTQILGGPPKPIRERNPAAHPGLTAVAENAMARELRDRYADMADIVDDLERVKAGKAPSGPHGVAQRVKTLPFSLWVPAGVILIAVGLWLLWPPAQPAKTAPTPTPTNVVITTPTVPMKPQPMVHTNWEVALLAGQPDLAGSNDGLPSEARFRSPEGIAVDPGGTTVYVADTGNNTIRKIAADGTVTTLAGQAGKAGDRDGQGSEALFTAPLGIAVDQSGAVYVTEFASDVIRRITPDGAVTTLAGLAGVPGSEDGIGYKAHFRNPWGIAVDPRGNVYVSDRGNYTIRQITPTGRVDTFAGRTGVSGDTDGFGSRALFGLLGGISTDESGFVYVADTGNNLVRQVFPTGQVVTLVGPGSGSQVQAVAGVMPVSFYILDDGCVSRLNGLQPQKLQLTNSDGRLLRPSAIAAEGGRRHGRLYLVEDAHNAIWEATPPSGKTNASGVSERARRIVLDSSQGTK